MEGAATLMNELVIPASQTPLNKNDNIVTSHHILTAIMRSNLWFDNKGIEGLMDGEFSERI